MQNTLHNALNNFAAPLLALPRPAKRAVALVVDASLCALAVWCAFYLRQDEFTGWTAPMVSVALGSVALALPIFISSGLYRAIFRYSSLSALIAVTRAMLVYGVVFASVVTWWGVPEVPRTVGLIQPLLLLLLIGGSRTLARVWLGGLYAQYLRRALLPQVLIYGAGSAGRQLAAAIASSHEMRAVGFLDDDATLHGHVLLGLLIHNPMHLSTLLEDGNITDILLAVPSVTRQRRNEILAFLRPHKVAVRTLPGLSDVASGKVTLSDVRELDIHDLLGREPVSPNNVLLHRNTHQKTVLVTGAGGSIGSELCRQILQTRPACLLLVEISEFALYQIHQELQPQAEEAGIDLVPLLASVCNQARMQEIMATWKPYTVYHAAAYKHVPLVEHNPAEGVYNNVWGTRVCAEAAALYGVCNFVLISTDKAVRPTNIMGATKRLAEMVLQALAESNSVSNGQKDRASVASTCFSMVRFGNVLGSSGSVVPLFRQQIRNGGPITLTHEDITRYFMTIPEAAQLVIQAGAMGTGGDVFVLDMGQPVKIIDLARRMVELSGLTVKDELNPQGDIELVITGLRPGEKLYEELLIGDNLKSTQHPRIMKAHEQFLSWAQLEEKLNALSIAISVNDVPVIRALLQQTVNGYQPSGGVVDWVHMAMEREAQANAY